MENKISNRVKDEPRTFKVKVDKKNTVNAYHVWTSGNPEGFLIHSISTLNYYARTKLFNKWTSTKNKKKFVQKGPPRCQQLYLGALQPRQPEADELNRDRAHHAKVLVKYNAANEKMKEASTAIFALYKNLLDETTLLKWNKQQANRASPWTNLNGETHNTIHKKIIKYLS